MRIKYLLIGLVAGAFLATAGTSIASSVFENVTATVRADFRLVIDGESVQLKNAPLIYNDASYLPVRELSTILGRDVDFDKDTILLTTKEESANMDGWISLKELAGNHGVLVQTAGTEMTIGNLKFDLPEVSENSIVVVNANDFTLSLRFDDFRWYALESQMRDLGVIQ